MVGERYFDPTFGVLDWTELHDRYQPRVAAAEDARAFYEQVNRMLFELNVSHLLLLPREEICRIDPILTSEGSIGVDLCLLEGQAVVSAVEPGSPGEAAGLHTGTVVTALNGKTVQQWIDDTRPIPPFNDRHKRTQRIGKIQEQVYGPPGASVHMVCVDREPGKKEVVLRCRTRPGRVLLGDFLPPCFVRFE